MSESTPADLTAMAERARRAAFGWGGQWSARQEALADGEELHSVDAPGKRAMVSCEDPDVIAHIAGMSPQVTLDLLLRLTRAEARLAALDAPPAQGPAQDLDSDDENLAEFQEQQRARARAALADSCCGACPADTCFVDALTAAQQA